MKNVLAFMLFACLLLACQDKGEALRQKCLAEMEERIEKALEKSNQNAVRALERKVRKEGSSPEGLNAVKIAREIRQKTKKYTNIATHEQYMQTQLQSLMSAEEWKETKRNIKTVNNPKIRVLHWEHYFLQKMGAGDMSRDIICFFDSPISAIHSSDTLREGERFEATLFYDSQQREYEIDSIWVNGILNTSKPWQFSLPKLQAGKQAIDLKIKYTHKYLPEKDTLLFYTHHFHVLPTQKP